MDKNGYNQSILQDRMECWVSHQHDCDLVRHEVFYGSGYRKLSKRHGLWVYLTPYWHNMSNEAVHNNKELDTKLKQFAQRKFEELYSHEEFIKIYGRSWL